MFRMFDLQSFVTTEGLEGDMVASSGKRFRFIACAVPHSMEHIGQCRDMSGTIRSRLQGANDPAVPRQGREK